MDHPQSSTFRTPFSDSAEISPASSISGLDPSLSRRIAGNGGRNVKYAFTSYKLRGEYQTPWAGDARLKRGRISNWIIWTFVALAIALSAFINWNVTRKVQNHEYCMILDEQFHALDASVWNHEVQLDGFGNGCFDWTTDDSKNSFVDKDGLHIVPTLTTDSTPITRDQIYDAYTLNLTRGPGGDGSCTGSTVSQCSIRSNGSEGVIIPPVRSARLNTRGKKSIRYGKVEVIAKLPKGEWLWPAIWMMPEDSVYGDWPRSGEIDIAEARGNDVNYDGGVGGRDTYLSTLHWGPSSRSNAYYLANKGRQIRRTDFSKGFHKFGLEWSEDYLFTYLDSRLQQVLYWRFTDENMFQRGGFASQTENSTLLANPWIKGGKNAPFDQKFYLILNVAVGSRNAWFKDGVSGKPWTDGGNSALDFYKAIESWYPSWPADNERGMTVKSVKMWQQGACGSAP